MTNAVFPSGLHDCSEDADMTQYVRQLTDGYSQSKWVAEQLVIRARNKGLPAAIYRLGNLAGDSVSASWNPLDFIIMVLRTCLCVKSAPDVQWELEMTPVDFVSGILVELTQNILTSLGKVFHVVNTQTIQARWVFEWLQVHGYRLNICPYSDWIRTVEAATPSEDRNIQKTFDSLTSWGPSYLSEVSTYKNANFISALEVLGRDYPVIDRALLQTYFKGLADRGVVPEPTRLNSGTTLLNGKVAIVTGASSGIGASIAKHLAQAGAKVALAARRVDRLKELHDTIEKDGGVAISVATDVTDRNQVLELVKHTELTLGPVDILVNNAGCMFYTMMKNVHFDEWDKQVDVNCKGTMYCVGAVLPGMIERSSGHIVNMSSDVGRQAFAGLAVYSGTKYFIEGMSKALRVEVANTGVKVTCIQPGNVTTEIGDYCTDPEAKEKYGTSGGARYLDSDDVGRSVLYAVTQPEHVAINEILIEPREEPI